MINNNVINWIIVENKMDTVFMNSENSKTSYPHRLLLNLWDNIDLKRIDKDVALSNLLHLLYMEEHKKILQK